MAEERRQSPRAPTTATAEVHLKAGDQFRLTCPIDASRGGMLICLPERLKPGQMLRMTLRLPSGETLAVNAEVRHVARDDEGRFPNFRTGIAFRQLSEFEERLLARYFDARTQKEPVTLAR